MNTVQAGQTIYVSGPMTGLPEHNVPEFNRVTAILRQAGFTVRNPAENDNSSRGKSWSFYMRMDVQHVALSDALVLLDHWEHSRGAQLEIAIAERLEIPIYKLEVIPQKDADNALIFEEIFPIVTVDAKLNPGCAEGFCS